MPTTLSSALLSWYDSHRRRLAWRAEPGEAADPYRVWLSEIMLQQTVARTVIPYFTRFVETWPTVKALAQAPLDAVLTAWAGLGYYARARNLHKCAQVVAEQLNGVFPNEAAELRALPGIGAYTAGAIAAIAFNRREAAVDGNVERVVARLYALETPLPAAKVEIRALTQNLVPGKRPGDFAQGLMDLGATICTPKKPRCLLCPLKSFCAGFATAEPERYPLKAEKKAKPVRYGRVYWVEDPHGSILVRRRAETGLLGGMAEFPSSPWDTTRPSGDQGAPLNANWVAIEGIVRHTFTHFHLELEVVRTRLTKKGTVETGFWVAPDRFGEIALPSLMRKVANHALERQRIGDRTGKRKCG
jgi:A/G-specific adenine glycosylase